MKRNHSFRHVLALIALLLGTTLAVSPAFAWAQEEAASSVEEQTVEEASEGSAEDSTVESDESPAEETESSTAPDEVNGEPLNSWRFQDGVYVGGGNQNPEISLMANSSNLVTWRKKSDGTIVFSNGIKTTGAYAVGVDVSAWQGNINWSKVKAAGVDFAILRCGYGGDETEWDDTYFLQNVRGCQQNDIPFGIYLYSYGDTKDPMGQTQSEIDHTLRLLKEAGLEPSDLDYPVYYDLEDDSVLEYGKSTILKCATAYCEAIEAEGYRAGVYANLNWWNNYLTSSTYNQWERWVAQYYTHCEYDGDYAIWQCTSSGKVNGISGATDMNLQYEEIDFGPGGGFVIDSNGKRFLKDDGTYAQNEWVSYKGKHYYFADDTYAVTGEQTVGGKRYFFLNDGSRFSGWVYWKAGGRSYFSSAHNGAAAVGWWTIGGKAYYFSYDTRRAVTGEQVIDGKHYFFQNDGSRFSGWVYWKAGGRSYFSANHKGAAAVGWWTIGGKSYYFSYDDFRALTGEQVIGGKHYYFLSNGSRWTGWVYWKDGTRSFFSRDNKGSACKGWWTINGKRYYFSFDDCRAYTGTHVISGVQYTFSDTGALIS